jgi:hypothetical protein
MKAADAIALIQQRIKPGMTRTLVEREIAQIPNVHSVYQSAAHIFQQRMNHRANRVCA